MQTFDIPRAVTGTPTDLRLGRQLIAAWRRDGIFQVATQGKVNALTQLAFDASRRFFRLPPQEKARCVSDLSYSGYSTSGEEAVAGRDCSEVFTVCKDLPLSDPRVRANWPCHGPAPWPDGQYRDAMNTLMRVLGSLGEEVLRLTALGLDLPLTTLTDLTHDGWHHMRIQHLPALKTLAPGPNAPNDHGLLVIAAQDDAGSHCTSGRLAVSPGDILQFISAGHLVPTPHELCVSRREQFALAYSHGPNFEACARPLKRPGSDELIHYGTHFTCALMRSHPRRITTRRIRAEGRTQILAALREAATCPRTNREALFDAIA